MLVPKNYLYYDLWKELDKIEATLYLAMAPQQIKSSYFQMSYDDLIRATKLSEKLVKEGIVGLAEKGFLLIQHTKRKNAYRVLEFWKQREDKTYCEEKAQILNARILYKSNPIFSKSKEEKRKERLQRTAKYLSKQVSETEGTGF
jgi:hypothetical protein